MGKDVYLLGAGFSRAIEGVTLLMGEIVRLSGYKNKRQIASRVSIDGGGWRTINRIDAEKRLSWRPRSYSPSRMLHAGFLPARG